MHYFWAVLGFVLVYLLREPFATLLTSHNARRVNYSGRLVSFPWGAPLVLVVTTVFSLRLLAEGVDPLLWRAIFVLYAAGFLGLVDDMLGDGACRGLRGHLQAFFYHSKLTSGLIKAVAGLIIALTLASPASGIHLLLVDALDVALAMNAINLLDVRPGRAGKGVLLLLVTLALTGKREAFCLVGLPVAGGLLAYLPLDLREEAMLGDTGANALGATVGLIIIHDLTWGGHLMALVLLVALHGLCAICSLSQIITRVPSLAALDRLGRIRR